MSAITNTSESSDSKMEILLFSLGTPEVFGINVFKIREVTEIMPVTAMPGVNSSLMGMVSLRGNVLPVVHLGEAVGMGASDEEPKKLIIAEFASRTVAFAVSEVDKIVRVAWSEVKPPQHSEGDSGTISGVILLNDEKLVSLLDIEAVCQRELPMEDTNPDTSFSLAHKPPVFFVDDSIVARKQISRVLDAMGLRHMHAINGDEAQSKLMSLFNSAGATPHEELVSLVLVDEEMPGMDGCALTRKMKRDPRFKNVPFIMYSSLTSAENERRGLEAGCDLYVNKFDANKLSTSIGRLLESNAVAS